MVIETERLILRNYREADFDDYWEFVSQTNVASRCGWATYTDKEMAKKRLQIEITKPLQFAIELKAEHKVVGAIEIIKDFNIIKAEDFGYDSKDAVELGYLLNENYWNGGIMTEAVQAVVKYCFEVLKVKVIFCGYYAPNLGSCRVQEKIGFHYFTTKKDALIWYETQKPCDLIVTILTLDEYLNKDK